MSRIRCDQFRFARPALPVFFDFQQHLVHELAELRASAVKR